MTTTIHIVTGGKGNVGKTAFASVLRCLAMQASADPQLVDADAKKQTLSSVYGTSVEPISLSDDPSEEAQPDIVWYLAQTNQRDVIVDMAAQSDQYITDWIESRGVIEMAKNADIQIIKWWISDLDPSSFTELLDLCKDYQDDIQHVLVKSQYRAKAKMWNAAISRNERLQAALHSGDLPAIEFPRLFTGLMDKMRDGQQKFYECIMDDEYKTIDMLNRSTVMRWVARCKAEIDPVFQFTKFTKAEPSKSELPESEPSVSELSVSEPSVFESELSEFEFVGESPSVKAVEPVAIADAEVSDSGATTEEPSALATTHSPEHNSVVSEPVLVKKNN